MKLLYVVFAMSLLTGLLLSGCEPSSAPSASSPRAEEAGQLSTSVKPNPQTLPEATAESKDNHTTTKDESLKPDPLIAQSPETGSPKEEKSVADSKKPQKISTLKPIYSVCKNCVAITIDDGPTKYTKELLKVLKEYDTHVTFFFLGQNATAYPESVTQAVYEGNEIGYHSDTHPQMSKMTFDAQEKEFDSGLLKLQKWDSQPVTLFRPPYGAYNNDTKLITEDHHMSMVLWNEDPKDWSSTDPAKIAKSVVSGAQSGSIIVLHDHPSTIAALPAIIKGIKNKGYKLVMLTKH